MSDTVIVKESKFGRGFKDAILQKTCTNGVSEFDLNVAAVNAGLAIGGYYLAKAIKFPRGGKNA